MNDPILFVQLFALTNLCIFTPRLLAKLILCCQGCGFTHNWVDFIFGISAAWVIAAGIPSI